MSFFSDEFNKISSRIPPGIIGPIGTEIRNAVFGKGGNPISPVANIPIANESETISFKKFMADVRSRGVARNNRFIVRFLTIPNKLKDRAQSIGMGFSEYPGKSMDFLNNSSYQVIARSCETAAFPGETIQTQESRFQSYLAKFPTIRNYNETTWTFRCDNEMLEKKFFDMWMGSIINRATGDVTYKKEYTSQAQIIQFNEHGRPIYMVILDDIFPFQLADLELNHQGGSDYHRLSVTFSFSKMYISAIDDPEYDNIDAMRGATGQPLSLYDKITNEVFKVGRNIVLKEINKNIPIGNIPGIGNSRDILRGFGL